MLKLQQITELEQLFKYNQNPNICNANFFPFNQIILTSNCRDMQIIHTNLTLFSSLEVSSFSIWHTVTNIKTVEALLSLKNKNELT